MFTTPFFNPLREMLAEKGFLFGAPMYLGELRTEQGYSFADLRETNVPDHRAALTLRRHSCERGNMLAVYDLRLRFCTKDLSEQMTEQTPDLLEKLIEHFAKEADNPFVEEIRFHVLENKNWELKSGVSAIVGSEFQHYSLDGKTTIHDIGRYDTRYMRRYTEFALERAQKIAESK